MIDPQRHSQNRNVLENMVRHIPGFKGYLEKEERRESDYLARKWMADQLQKSKGSLDDFLRTLVDAGKLDDLTSFETLRSRIDTLVNRIRSAERGYSGLFDFVKVSETELDQVYQLDMALVADVPAFVEMLEGLSSSSDAPRTLANNLIKKLDTLDKQFARRGEVLKGLGPQ